MATYYELLDLITSALTGRPAGSRVQVENHEAVEIALLDYIENIKQEASGTIIREAHASAIADTNCDLVWDQSFEDTNYSYVVNGHDADGNPVQIQFVSRSSTKLVVQTFINATLTAIAKPYGS